MIVLGVQRGHDGGVCIMANGRVLSVVEAERVHRIKHVDGPGAIPEAFRVCLDDAGLSAAAIDRIVIADAYRENVETAHPTLVGAMHGPELLASLGAVGSMANIGGDLGLAGVGLDVPVFAVCHHAAHAAAAIYMSGFDECLAFVYDGYGICCGSMAYSYRKGRLERVEESRDRILIGWRYQLMAQFVQEIDKTKTLVYDLAGKIMGLNAFGRSDRKAVETMKDWLREDFENYKRSWDATSAYWFPGLVNERGFGINQSSARDEDYLTLLASTQEAINEVVCEEILQTTGAYGHDRVVVAGGCAYNILTNDALDRLPTLRDVFVPPNAGDSGLAMGAAVAGSHDLDTGLHFGSIELREKRSPYKGPRLLVAKAAPEMAKPHAKPGDREALDAIVDRLRQGGIVGFVKGRLEIGPRALGHRSLLADATHPDMREIINRRVKVREWWRPFAPVVRSVDAHEYFEFGRGDPYMLRSAIVRPNWRARLPAVTHEDFSTRLQVIQNEEDHPELWHILSRLCELTGIGVCLNTSLNLGGQPILNSVEEIHQILEKQEIDFVYANGELIHPRRGVA